MSTRERIVTAAMHLAVQDGLSALSVRKVAAATGIGPSTLRHHFPTMGALHEAILDAQRRDTFSDLALDDADHLPHQRLAQALAQFLEPVESPSFRLATAEAHVAALTDEEFSQRVLSTSQRRAHETILGWLRRLAAEGALPATDLDDLAGALVAFVAGLIVQRSFVSAEQTRRALESLCAHILSDDQEPAPAGRYCEGTGTG